ncbi:MAG TPA: iron uptake transporter deferrochelatase/peroxidase subunit [Solirubrobacterales bacterium]|nr:iron uptake transporter deferrochelatase/peroxidase subunit [Solirubrobacterales bacterium]
MDSDQTQKSGITRRGVLAGAALLGVGAGLDRLLTDVVSDGEEGSNDPTADGLVSFYGPHQAGIATLAPEFLSFAAFDLTSGSVDDLRAILQEWTSAAALLTRGETYKPASGEPSGAPADPGEAIGLGPASLTITIGFGPGLFGISGADRFGFGRRRPKALAPLPAFKGESLDPSRSGGDLCVQACADDPQVAFHAVHVLTRIASGAATLRWMQEGFGRTSSTSNSQPTPRNLMGFKDGTNSIRGEDGEAMEKHVWVQPGDGPAWMEGGSYLVARRIKILLDVWDATSLEGQERSIGREKVSGAPIGGTNEFDPVDLNARRGGEPAIPVDAHIRLSSPESNDGKRILRRGYSFSESPEPGSGQIDAGLFFISFQRDPQRQFVPIQRRLAESDALNRHVQHTASAVFACPPGIRPGGFVGEGLFA